MAVLALNEGAETGHAVREPHSDGVRVYILSALTDMAQASGMGAKGIYSEASPLRWAGLWMGLPLKQDKTYHLRKFLRCEDWPKNEEFLWEN